MTTNEFVRMVARMTKDGEGSDESEDGEDEGFIMENGHIAGSVRVWVS